MSDWTSIRVTRSVLDRLAVQRRRMLLHCLNQPEAVRPPLRGGQVSYNDVIEELLYRIDCHEQRSATSSQKRGKVQPRESRKAKLARQDSEAHGG